MCHKLCVQYFSIRKMHLFVHNLFVVVVVQNGVANFIKEVHKCILTITPILQQTTKILMNEILRNIEKHQRKSIISICGCCYCIFC